MIEDLHDSPQAINDIKVAFRVEPYPLGSKHVVAAVTRVSDGVLECTGPIERLNAKIHRVYNDQFVPDPSQLGRIVEFTVTGAALTDRPKNLTLHIEDKDFMPQRVGDVDVSIR